eukprot:g10593.t1
MGAGLSSGDGNGGNHQADLDPLSAAVCGYDVKVPEDPTSISGRVRGELSLLFVLRDPHLHRLFEEWLIEHSAQSLLKFWVECDDYNSSVQQWGKNLRFLHGRFLHARATGIYEKYLKPGCMPNSLELDMETREEIARILGPPGNGASVKLLRNDGLFTIFDAVLRKTFHTLLFDYLPDFLASTAEVSGESRAGISGVLGEGGQSGQKGGPGGGGATNGCIADSTTWRSPMLKVTAGKAFLENPRLLSHIKQYLSGVDFEGEGGGSDGDGGEKRVASRFLDCLESIREYQEADTTERRQELWTAVRRRYCGEAGVAAPALDALSALAATEDLHPAADMLDEAYDEIVDTLMMRHLAGYYQILGRFFGEKSNSDGKGGDQDDGHGRRPPTRDPTAPQAATHPTRAKESYKLPDRRDSGGSDGVGSPQRARGTHDGSGCGGGCDSPTRAEFYSREPASEKESLRPRTSPLLEAHALHVSSKSPGTLSPNGGASASASPTGFTGGDTTAPLGGGVDCSKEGYGVGKGEPQPPMLRPLRQRPQLHQQRRNSLLGSLPSSQGQANKDQEPGEGEGGGEEEEEEEEELEDRRRHRSESVCATTRKMQLRERWSPKADPRRTYGRLYGMKTLRGMSLGAADGRAGRHKLARSNSDDFEELSGGLQREWMAQADLHEPERITRASSETVHMDWKPFEVVDFHTLLNDPLGIRLFRRISIEFYQEENLSLWVELASFRAGQYAAPQTGAILDVGEGDSIAVIRARRARLIYNTYISESAENQVNLSSRSRETALRNVESLERAAAAPNRVGGKETLFGDCDHCNLFDDIQREVFRLMETNLWTSFKHSHRFKFYASKYWSHHARRSDLSVLGATGAAAVPEVRSRFPAVWDPGNHEKQQQEQRRRQKNSVKRVEEQQEPAAERANGSASTITNGRGGGRGGSGGSGGGGGIPIPRTILNDSKLRVRRAATLPVTKATGLSNNAAAASSAADTLVTEAVNAWKSLLRKARFRRGKRLAREASAA